MLGVLRVDARGRTVASIEDVRSEVVLHELRELSVDHPSLSRGKLERVLAHDAEHNSAYVETLRAYLDCFGDVPRAAERIAVHPNTFRYRMRRLVELFEPRPRRTRTSASCSSCSSGCSRRRATGHSTETS